MEQTKFDRALVYTLENEGGFSNHPLDRGGATMLGITQDTYARWLKRPVSVSEMRMLTANDVAPIYHAFYWTPINADQILDSPTATAIFDMAVNFGPSASQRLAQATCNDLGLSLAVDGKIGPKSLSAINSLPHEEFIDSFRSHVLARYAAIVDHNPSQAVFLKGWRNRADRLLTLKSIKTQKLS